MYGKLFESFWKSSINQNEKYPTRLAFQYLFTTMNPDGYAHCPNAGVLARSVNITLEEAEEAIRVLTSPDPESTNPEHEGRRIEKVPGGFLVLNGVYYRELRNSEMEREQVRLRVRKHRKTKEKRDVTECNVTVPLQNVTSVSSSAYASVSVSNKKKKLNKETVWTESDFFDFGKFREGLNDWPEEKVKHFHAIFTETEAMKPGKYKYADWCMAARKWDRREPWKEQSKELRSISEIMRGEK